VKVSNTLPAETTKSHGLSEDEHIPSPVTCTSRPACPPQPRRHGPTCRSCTRSARNTALNGSHRSRAIFLSFSKSATTHKRMRVCNSACSETGPRREPYHHRSIHKTRPSRHSAADQVETADKLILHPNEGPEAPAQTSESLAPRVA
jgi:hypothetical protein